MSEIKVGDVVRVLGTDVFFEVTNKGKEYEADHIMIPGGMLISEKRLLKPTSDTMLGVIRREEAEAQTLLNRIKEHQALYAKLEAQE